MSKSSPGSIRCATRHGARLAAAALLAGLPALAAAAAAPPLGKLTRALVTTGLDQPVALTHAGDERLFVSLQDGRVLLLRGGAAALRPFLDIRSKVLAGGERGLLSIAFHPDYATNGYLFADYTDLHGDTVIARYQVSADPDLVSAASERVLLRIGQPFPNHNGGQLAFGPDGYLYVGLGDGGSGFDPQCNAQDGSSLLGKLLRLDVDSDAAAPPYHAIPPDNPYAGSRDPLGQVRDEIWALGLRNPWRFAFDRLTGDLFIADVGQGAREEIDYQPNGAGDGANYGWKMLEGTLCHQSSQGCDGPLPGCSSALYTPPLFEYGHTEGACAVIGGDVYRGGGIGGLQGTYFYGDFCSGQVWAAWRDGTGWHQTVVRQLESPGLTSFGASADGEIYFTAGSALYRILGPSGPGTPLPPPATGCSADATTLCLGADGRFRVRATFRVGSGPTQVAHAVPITDDTGYFWFFAPGNVELVAKVLDACTPFDRFWVFATGLTNVETELVVFDVEKSVERRYPSPAGPAFKPIQDTHAFATCP